MKDFIIYVIGHYQEILASGAIVLGALAAFLFALYNLALLIPGEQPDKFIKAIYDFTVKYSRKPAEDKSGDPQPPAA